MQKKTTKMPGAGSEGASLIKPILKKKKWIKRLQDILYSSENYSQNCLATITISFLFPSLQKKGCTRRIFFDAILYNYTYQLCKQFQNAGKQSNDVHNIFAADPKYANP